MKEEEIDIPYFLETHTNILLDLHFHFTNPSRLHRNSLSYLTAICRML